MVWHYSLTFDPKEPSHACVVSPLFQKKEGSGDPLILYPNRILPFFVLAKTIILRIFTRQRPTIYPVSVVPFWWANRLTVNALTGAHLSLVSGNAKRRLVLSIQPEAHFFFPHDMQAEATCECLTWSLSVPCLPLMQFLRLKCSFLFSLSDQLIFTYQSWLKIFFSVTEIHETNALLLVFVLMPF